MNRAWVEQQLEMGAQAVAALISGVSEEQARWRPDEESMSMLEVVNHLYDEELEDFPTRLRWVLEGRTGTWPEIDPGGWVAERRYNERSLAESVQNFLEARRQALDWLRSLKEPDWERAYQTPWGPLRAGDLLASWLAHDVLHMRQLTELHYAYRAQQMQPYSPGYAGEW